MAKGGTVANSDGKITVRGADEVVLLITADTDYRANYDPDFNDPKAYVGVDPAQTTAGWIKKAAAKGYASVSRPTARASPTIISNSSTTSLAATCS